VAWDKAAGVMRVDHSTFRNELVNDELPQDMRSTVLLYPGLLYRLKKISIAANTKGCSLGVREIDPHLEIFAKLGAVVDTGEPLVIALPNGFQGNRHWCDYMSVTVTENFLMAAAIGRGTSTLINAASEPHVQDLCAALTALGARIEGVGTSMLKVEGVESLGGGEVHISTDYHEVVTFLALGAITGGEVQVRKSLPRLPETRRGRRTRGRHGDRAAQPDPPDRGALHLQPAAQDRGGALALFFGRPAPADDRAQHTLQGHDPLLEQGL
jgi:UDP-N-acetylglucosamine 1-carboxyvinyltransferase